jgi:hypothetical protein
MTLSGDALEQRRERRLTRMNDSPRREGTADGPRTQWGWKICRGAAARRVRALVSSPQLLLLPSHSRDPGPVYLHRNRSHRSHGHRP